MALTCSKTSCALLLVFVVLTATKGAHVPRNGTHRGNSTHPENKHMVYVEMDPKYQTPTTNVASLNRISISPWEYNTSTDSSLYSPVHEVRCLLTGCLNSKNEEDLNLESRPIFHEMYLLRRVRSAPGQGYHLRLEKRLVAVGCTCVRPHILEQQ